MYFSLLQGQGTSFCPGSRGAPTLCMQGTTRCLVFIDLGEDRQPMRAMIRILTTTYGESVSCTPICDIGDPTGPMLKGSTYMVRPRMQPSEKLFQLLAHRERIFPVVGGAGAVF